MSLQKAAEKKFGTRPSMKLAMGDLIVTVDGKSVFRYKSEGKIPEVQDLLARIETARS